MLPLRLGPEKQILFWLPPQSQARHQGQGRCQVVWRICLRNQKCLLCETLFPEKNIHELFKLKNPFSLEIYVLIRIHVMNGRAIKNAFESTEYKILNLVNNVYVSLIGNLRYITTLSTLEFQIEDTARK